MQRNAAPSRRELLTGAMASAVGSQAIFGRESSGKNQALIAITLDLEMSAHYPRRGMTEWNYRKGDLDSATKKYAIEAGKMVKDYGGKLHYFCVGQTLEQPDIEWLKDLAKEHPIGNHTYDHVNIKAIQAGQIQFRFRRAPWLIQGRSVRQVITENIRLTTAALKERAKIKAEGFRTPGGFRNGLSDRPDLQKLLLGHGFSWVSSKYPSFKSGSVGKPPTEQIFQNIVQAQKQAQPFAYKSGLIEIPMSPISDVNAFRSLRWKKRDFLKAIRMATEWAIANGQVFDFLAHPSCLVIEDPGLEVIRMICEMVKKAKDRAAIVDLTTIAARARS